MAKNELPPFERMAKGLANGGQKYITYLGIENSTFKYHICISAYVPLSEEIFLT